MFNRDNLWPLLAAKKHSVHAYVATVSFHQGEPREVHFDQFQHMSSGFMFVRIDGSSTFISHALIAEIDTVATPSVAGSA